MTGRSDARWMKRCSCGAAFTVPAGSQRSNCQDCAVAALRDYPSLSTVMKDALEHIRKIPDLTVRYYRGGWWSARHFELGDGPGRFLWSTTNGTVTALARRGLLVEVERHPRHNFVTAYRIAP